MCSPHRSCHDVLYLQSLSTATEMHEPHCPLRNARYEIGLFPEIRRVDHREPFSVSRTSSLWMDSLVSGLKNLSSGRFLRHGRRLFASTARPTCAALATHGSCLLEAGGQIRGRRIRDEPHCASQKANCQRGLTKVHRCGEIKTLHVIPSTFALVGQRP